MTTSESVTPAIELRGLHKSFGANHVLRGVDLAVAPRQVVCVIGASGSGKSTLLRCVNRLEEPSAGAVLIDGIDITHPDCDLDLVRRTIGMVFQQPTRFPKSRYVNSAYRPKVSGLAKRWAAMDAIGGRRLRAE